MQAYKMLMRLKLLERYYLISLDGGAVMFAYLWEETGKAGIISYKSWKVRVQEVRLLRMGFFAPFLAEPHQLSM